MYLLMLLATFMSAIYGYNLSIRPDYDRDIPHKKALAVQFKFNHQHSAAKKIALNAGAEVYTGKGIPWMLPGDLIYADTAELNNDKQVLVYKQGGHEVSIQVRKKKNDVGGTEGDNIMRMGRTLFPSEMMTTQIVCPTKEIDEDDVGVACEPTKDEEGGVTKTCCGDATAYFVSYRILDARWLNRLTNKVNADFMWAVAKKSYAENIGVVNWDNKRNAWVFTGKIGLYAVYRKDKEEFEKTHNGDEIYPTSKRNRTEWVLPNKVFKSDFFKYMKGNSLRNDMCKNGCLVKIEEI